MTNRIPLVSTKIVSVAYDPSTQTLSIEFYNGTYEYYDVPPTIYTTLLHAPSPGRYHHRVLAGNYGETQVE